MSAIGRLVKFGVGGAVGAAVGGAAAFVFAPRSGEELNGKIRQRLAATRLAGAQAKAAKEHELIGRFRQSVNDPSALNVNEMAAHAAVADATRDAATAGVVR